jgi:hypothetical protein
MICAILLASQIDTFDGADLSMVYPQPCIEAK